MTGNKSSGYGLLFNAAGCSFIIPIDDILFIDGMSGASVDSGIYHCKGEAITLISLEKILKLEKTAEEKILIVVKNNFGITAEKVLGIELFSDLRQIKSYFANKVIRSMYVIEKADITAFELNILQITNANTDKTDSYVSVC